MWKGPNEDPGPPPGSSGSDPSSSPNPQLSDLKDENEQQQLLIAQLKEIIRKNEPTSVTVEKVEEFANTLAKAKRNKLKREAAAIGTKIPPQVGAKQNEGLKNQKLLLMKQQLEENKAKLAARGKSQKGIEDMVVQMKAQLDDSQNLMTQSVSLPMNLSSTTEPSKQYTSSSASVELLGAVQSKDKSVQALQSKVEQLEAQLLDLQENVKEKDSVIDARTKAITLMSENLSKKGKSTLDALDDTKEQMRQMQTSFIETEEKLKSDKQKLLQQIYEKDEQIANLRESNDELDQINKELTKLNNGLQERLNTRSDKSNEEYERNIFELKEKIKEFEDTNKSSPSKSRRNRKSSKQRAYEPNQNTEMEAKITFQQSIIADKQIEIENQQERISELEASVQNLKATIINVKGGKEPTESDSITENDRDAYENKIKEYVFKIEELKRKTDIDGFKTKLEEHKSKIEELENTVQMQRIQIECRQLPSQLHQCDDETQLQQRIEELSSQVKKIEPLQTELDELRSRVKVLQLEKQAIEYADVSTSSVDVEEMNKIKKQLDDNNKNMIKARAQHKAQMKELQKQLDAYKTGSTEGSELDKLYNENSKLLLKVAELEEEIGNMQLKMVESTDSNTDLTTETKNMETEKIKQIEELEINLVQCKNQIDTLNAKLESLSKFENAKVTSDLHSIQLEEQLESLELQTSRLVEDRSTLLTSHTEVQEKLESCEREKTDLDARVQTLIQENIELLDRLEKLSAEKVSSAESIEIVEGLTNQEKLEIEAYQMNLEKQKSEDNLSVGTPELNESVNQLTEETTELLQRIELFTEERREVMEKLEQLAYENNHLNNKLKESDVEKEKLQADKENAEKYISELSQNQIYITENMHAIESRYNIWKDNIEQLKSNLNFAINEEKASFNFFENMPSEFGEFAVYCKFILDKKLELVNSTKQNQNLQRELHEHKNELHGNKIAIENLNTELQTLLHHQKSLQEKYKMVCQDTDEFNDERHDLLDKIDDLKLHISDKDENYQRIVQDLKEKCLSLQEEIERNSSPVNEEPLKTQITELDIKNKELRDKMKIIAANMKKKNSAFDDLVKNTEQSREKWEMEIQEKDDQIESLTAQLNETKEFISNTAISEELEIAKNNLHQLTSTNSEMQLQLNDLLNLKIEHEEQIHLLSQETEINRTNVDNDFNNETISILQTELKQAKENYDISVNTLQIKVNELEMFIESQDQELTKHKVKVERLEEGLAMVEERRLSLERRAVELGSKLQEREISYEESIVNEDNLASRLRALAEHDAAIEKELSASAEENQMLTQQNNQLFNEIAELRSRLNSTTEQLSQKTVRVEQLGAIELDNEDLKQNIKRLESDLARLDKEIENLLLKQKSENEEDEMELHNQIKAFNEERKSLTEKCEMLEERLKEYQEHIESLNNTISEVKAKLQDHVQTIWRYNDEMQSLQGHIFEMESKCQVFENEVDTKTCQILKLDSELEVKETKISELEKNLSIMKNELYENKNQLNFAKNLMNQIEESNLDILGKNDELEKEIGQLELQNVKLQAHVPILQEKVVESTHTSALFGSPVDDPFAFVLPIQYSVPEDTITGEVPQANTETELLNKIRTLEFMLYNLEQEKNDLVSQCHKLTDEIAQLVYEKQSSKQANLPDVMSQIVPDSEAQVTAEDNKQILLSLFTPTTSKSAQENESVDLGIQAVEELIHARSAYLCYNQEQSSQSTAGVFGENDDGWGFVVDEQSHILEQIPIQQSQPNDRVLLDQISALELEREKHLEDLRQAQVKSGKLIKKLKEFKAKNEELAARLSKKDDGFDDLESAIQDELKSQVEISEKKVKEIQYELEKEKKENSSLITKINVLTSANERMVDMKEKQDVEMLGWQQRNQALVTKLKQFEWGSDETSPAKQNIIPTASNTSETNELEKRIEELSHTINELTLDNEELQAMLEEQRVLRSTFDTQKSVEVSSENVKATPEYLALLTDKKTIQTEYEKLVQININYTEELGKITYQLQKSNEERTTIEVDLNNLRQVHNTCNMEKQNLRDELDQLIQTHNKCSEEILAHTAAVEQYKTAIIELQTNLHHLERTQSIGNESNVRDIEENLIKQKGHFIEMENILSTSITALKNDNNALTKTLEETRNDIQNLKETVRIINAEKLDLQQKLFENVNDSNKIASLQESVHERQILLDEYENRFKSNEGELEMKVSAAIEQITLEWQARVDQRGNDIAESWKLHVETKENEFMHLEQKLRKEINELDQKCIGLVNENNELRKNVDAEIRNEVDRVSALQQQINDKQHCINELRRVIDEKQIELNELHTQVLENDTAIQQLNLILQEKDVEFQKKIQTNQLEAEDKQRTINELNNKLDNVEVGDSVNNLEVQECHVIIKDLRQEIATQQQLNNDLTISVNGLKNQMLNQRREIAEARGEKDMIASFLDEVNLKREAEVRTFAELNQQIEQYQYKLAQYTNEASDKEATIAHLNSQIEIQSGIIQEMTNESQMLRSNVQDVSEKKDLIAKLNKSIQEKEEEVMYLSDNQELESSKLIEQHRNDIETMKKCLLEADDKYEALQVLYNQLSDIQAKYNINEEILLEKDKTVNDLLQRDQEHEVLHNDEHKQLEEMRQIIENQVLKIEELKKELYDKSTSYDALFAQVEMQQSDMEQPQIKPEKRVQFATSSVEVDLSEPVNRAELDLALYMLYQRDVRCEELTLELMQLLEERDALQLRLSSAIREKEVIRGQHKPYTGAPDQISNDTTNTGAIPKTRAILLGATNTEMAFEATETDGGEKSLNTKLSELKSVGYRRDKTLLDEQDYRRMQQMTIMSQHIDEASKLPAEAAARLVDANYTLSRDVQSPSKVLLNWLWGRSTPKVNNI